MGHLTRITFMILFIWNLLITYISCAPSVTDIRKEGFKLTQQAFESFEQTPDLYEIIELRQVKLYIVGDRKDFKWDKASAYGSPVAGYATVKNEIYVFGKRVGNKVIVNQSILGHELNHLLHWQNPKIADPDKLDRLELCYLNGFIFKECKN